jgi:hypothetical protein
MAIGKSKLHEMLRKNRAMNEGVVWIKSIDSATRTEILRMIKQDQLTAKGIDATGEVIGYYSLATELITKGRKQQGDHYTLDDTGYFYKSMFIRVLANEILIDADGQKDEENIIDKYGSKILNLTNENLQLLIERVKKAYIKELRRRIYA